jgi:hypothetical protein
VGQARCRLRQVAAAEVIENGNRHASRRVSRRSELSRTAETDGVAVWVPLLTALVSFTSGQRFLLRGGVGTNVEEEQG